VGPIGKTAWGYQKYPPLYNTTKTPTNRQIVRSKKKIA